MIRILAPCAVFVIALPLAVSAFKEGPYPNVTGGFGEQTCHLCHIDNPINAPGGTLTLDGVPASFAPDQAYPITVTISRQGLRRGGFEIAARFAGGRQKGRQAGSWRLLDARAQFNVAANASNNDDSPLGDYIYIEAVRSAAKK